MSASNPRSSSDNGPVLPRTGHLRLVDRTGNHVPADPATLAQMGARLDDGRFVDVFLEYRRVQFLEGLDPNDLPNDQPEPVDAGLSRVQRRPAEFPRRRPQVLADLMAGSIPDINDPESDGHRQPPLSPPPYIPPQREPPATASGERLPRLNHDDNDGLSLPFVASMIDTSGVAQHEYQRASEARGLTSEATGPRLTTYPENMPMRSRSRDRREPNSTALGLDLSTVLHSYRDTPQNTPRELRRRNQVLSNELVDRTSELLTLRNEIEQLRLTLSDREHELDIIERWLAQAQNERDAMEERDEAMRLSDALRRRERRQGDRG